MNDLKELGVHTLELDVTSDESVANALKYIEKESGGRLDFLFNNAGASCTFPAMDLKVADAEACFAVNFFGVIRVTKLFLPLLIEAKGAIVQTGSVAGKLPFPFASVYSASKAALHQYSDVLRIELAPFGVKVVTLVVAAVLTDIADDRPLPKDSLYIDIEADGVQARRTMAKDNSPMPANVFAERVVHKLTTPVFPPRNIWDGHGAWFLWFLNLFVPKFLIALAFARRFKLNRLASLIQAKKAKSN
jgi:1-acylglycerone phosphate reductase